MLKVERALLTYIKSNQPCPWIDVLNAVRPESEADFITLEAILQNCLSRNWIETIGCVTDPKLCSVRATAIGVQELMQDSEKCEKEKSAEQKRLQELDRQMSKEQADQKREFRFQLFNTLLGALVGAVLTLLVEHFTGIISAITSLVQ